MPSSVLSEIRLTLLAMDKLLATLEETNNRSLKKCEKMSLKLDIMLNKIAKENRESSEDDKEYEKYVLKLRKRHEDIHAFMKNTMD